MDMTKLIFVPYSSYYRSLGPYYDIIFSMININIGLYYSDRRGIGYLSKYEN